MTKSGPSDLGGARLEVGAPGVLLISGDGALASSLGAELEHRKYGLTRKPPDAPGLFETAQGHTAVVYASASNLLEGRLAPAPDLERLREALRASNAPGVEVIIVLQPAAPGYEDETRLLAKFGKPFIVLRAAPLLTEFGHALGGTETPLWLPREGRIRAVDSAVLADAVVAAIHSEEQGRCHDVPADRYDAATLARRAADTLPEAPPVRGVWPPIFRAVRPIARFIRGGEPGPMALFDDLLQDGDEAQASAGASTRIDMAKTSI